MAILVALVGFVALSLTAIVTASPASATDTCYWPAVVAESNPPEDPPAYYYLYPGEGTSHMYLGLTTSVTYNECYRDGPGSGPSNDYTYFMVSDFDIDFYVAGVCATSPGSLSSIVFDPEQLGTWDGGTRTWNCSDYPSGAIINQDWNPTAGMEIRPSTSGANKCIGGTIKFDYTSRTDVTQSLPTICLYP